MTELDRSKLQRRTVGDNVWLSYAADEAASLAALGRLEVRALQPEILPSEAVVGAAMRAEPEASPGLWVRFHPSFRSLILPDVLS